MYLYIMYYSKNVKTHRVIQNIKRDNKMTNTNSEILTSQGDFTFAEIRHISMVLW